MVRARLPTTFAARVVALALAGLLLRVVVAVVFAFDEPRGLDDRSFYHDQANALVAGKGFLQPFLAELNGVEVPSAEHPPLWPLVLAAASLLGFDGWESHQLVGTLVGAGVVAVVAYVGREAAGDRAGLAAGAVAAGYPTFLAADASLMSETLYGLLVAVTLLLALRLARAPRPREAALLGGAIGLAALTRSEALLLLPLLALALLAGHPRPTRRAWIGGTAIAAGVAVLVIAPWTLRNLAAFGQPVLISTNDSTTLAGANCPQTWTGPDTGYWRLDCISGRDPALNEAEQAQRWRSAALAHIGDNLGDLPRLAFVRVRRTWDLYEPRRQLDFATGRDRAVQTVGNLVYAAIAGLFLAGLAQLRRRPVVLAVLVAPVVMVTATSVIGYGTPRFRHAAEVVLVVGAGVALERLVARVRADRRARAAPAGTDPADVLPRLGVPG